MIHYVPISDLAAASRHGGVAGKGPQLMTVLSAIRDRFSGRVASSQSGSAGDPQGDPVAEARPPFAGYDRLDKRQVMDEFSDHSQIELEAAESYERSHKDREPVLTKLRYMRGREPLPGYDALGVEEIVAALGEADLATIKKVRTYERKFANRPEVLEEVVRVHSRRQASEPKSAVPKYQSLGGASVSSGPAGRPEESGRS
jgi:hypothetical protein